MQYLAFFLLDSDPTAAIVALMAIIPIIILVCLLIILIPFWFILKKAGFSPWLTLINIVPLGNLF